MNQIEITEIKKDLEVHILECQNMLLELDNSVHSTKYKLELENLSNFIKGKDSKVLSKISDEKKFVKLIDSIPSVAIQGYNKEREVIYWNHASEVIYGYTALDAIGKKLEDLIIPPEAKEKVIAGITDWYENGNAIPAGELFLLRKDKTTVHVFSSHVMLGEKSLNPEIFCIDIDLSEIYSLRVKNKSLEKKAYFDKLTNIYNRHYFESIIENKMSNSKINKTDLFLIMFDIDHFKKINDQYGHDVGDEALKLLVKIVQETIRANDILVRWGGEEFMLLMETDFSNAKIIANKLRENIKLKTSESENIPSFTCSFGLVNMLNFNNFEKAYHLVDEKLYLAKNDGRDNVKY